MRKSKTLVDEGEIVPVLNAHDLCAAESDMRVSSGPLFLRDFELAREHDFDRAVDKFRLFMRYAPDSALHSSGFNFIKNGLVIDLPPRGTAERNGAELVLGAVATLLGDINSDL